MEKKNLPQNPEFTIYTDGAYSRKHNEGAFAFVVIDNTMNPPTICVKRAYKIVNETNQRAELKAIITAIHQLPVKTKSVEVVSDSVYAIKTLSGEWSRNANKDLFISWEQVISRHKGINIKYTWVKGHSGNKYNEMCDKMCADKLGYDPQNEYAEYKKSKNEIKIKHISTHWTERDRVVFVTEDLNGLVEIEYPKDHPNIGYIWHLWVNESCRRKGYAKALLKAAEEHIKQQGKQSVTLEWERCDTPQWTLEWYKRNGYVEKASDKHRVQLKKAITNPNA